MSTEAGTGVIASTNQVCGNWLGHRSKLVKWERFLGGGGLERS